MLVRHDCHCMKNKETRLSKPRKLVFLRYYYNIYRVFPFLLFSLFLLSLHSLSLFLDKQKTIIRFTLQLWNRKRWGRIIYRYLYKRIRVNRSVWTLRASVLYRRHFHFSIEYLIFDSSIPSTSVQYNYHNTSISVRVEND